MLTDSTRRSIRTAFDVIPAFLAALAILVPVLDLPAETVAKVGAVVGAITLALAKIRNSLEDSGVIPAVLKAPASDGADPVPDAGYVRLGSLIGIVLLVVGIVLLFKAAIVVGVILVLLGAFLAAGSVL